MAKRIVETRWVIVGVHGLYTGQWLRRKDAIEKHVEALYGPDVNAWPECRRKGDRCVKATITVKP